MKNHITLILVLMSLCVTGIIGLQLFWSYQHYQSTVKAFDHDINEALNKAVERETQQRQDEIIKRFKGWLADTSLITITADHNNRDSSTVFYTQDTHPKFAADKQRKAQFGLTDFNEKLDHITPNAKAFMIEHFGDRVLKRDLKEGIVYNYTQMLGDSLGKVFNGSKVDLIALQKLFASELLLKNINAPFVLNPLKKSGFYLTKAVNTNFRKPFKNDFVVAGFESPDRYFFREMKWILISSLLLIGITMACFTYTAKTLLSQQKLAELKQAFVNNMTHELNTPISSIKITAESLKTFKHEPERQIEYLDIISYQADKLSDLTAQILNTSQLTGANEMNRMPINLNELIAEAIRDLKVQAESVEAHINYMPGAAMMVNGERSSLLHVFTNILDNALKYNSGIPMVTIEVSRTGGYAEIAVSDNGVGIPPEYREKVFEQFFRVPQGNLHNVKGYGLGLSYVCQIVKQHQGLITLTGNIPTGSVVTLKLPLA